MKSINNIQAGVQLGIAGTLKKAATAWATLSLLAVGSVAFALPTPPPGNTPPVVTSFSVTSDEDTNVNLLSQAPGNVYTDADNDTITHMRIVSVPANGRLVVNGPLVLNAGDVITIAQLYGLTFVPDANWNGTDSFIFNCSDGTDFADNDATVTLNVTAVNDAPTGITITNVNVNENMPINSTVGFLSALDVDAGDTHTYSLVAGTGDADNASFNLVANKLQTSESFNFEVKSSYSVRIRVEDSGAATFDMPLIINVNDVNDVPTAGLVTATVAQGSTLTFQAGDFILQYSDEDNDPLDRIQINSLPIIGSLELAGTPVNIGDEVIAADLGNLRYIAPGNFAGRVSFDWKSYDGSEYSDYDGKVDIRVTMDNNIGATISTSTTGVAATRPLTPTNGGLTVATSPTGTSPTRPGSGGGGFGTSNNRMADPNAGVEMIGIAGMEAPLDYMVHNSYPNPFNDETTIRYELPASYHVQIKVYDQSGKEVSILTDGIQEAGVQTIKWNPSSKLPNGQYFYSIDVMDQQGAAVSHKAGTMIKVK